MAINQEPLSQVSLPYPDLQNGMTMDDFYFDDNNKALADGLNECIGGINNLKSSLASGVDGDSGADNIKITPIAGVDGITAQSALESIKAQLNNVVLNQIPNNTITPSKMAFVPLMEEENVKQAWLKNMAYKHVANRIPNTDDNFAAGYQVGDSWHIPYMTLKNLIPSPTSINIADWVVQNCTGSVSGSQVDLTCLNGFNYSTFKTPISPKAGHKYVVYADVTLKTANTITSITLNNTVINNPVKDTVYHMASVVDSPTQFIFTAQALNETNISNAMIRLDKMCVVDMTADMPYSEFTKDEASAYFNRHLVFGEHKFEFAGLTYKCINDGRWILSNVITDEIASMFGFDNVIATTEDIFTRLAPSYHALPYSEKNIAYLLAMSEINGKVQNYTNYFYDLFYTGHTQKAGFIDNRYMVYTGTIAANANVINSANINFTNFGITSDNRNSEYQEFTITDGTNSELIYAKGIPNFDSATYTGTYPATFKVPVNGEYTITMKGGKGKDTGYGSVRGYGGKGGTIVFKINAVTTDTFVVDKVPGSGNGIKLTCNGTVIAVVGGGGKAGGGMSFGGSDTMYLQENGGDGGGANGGDPYATPGGKGRWGGYSGFGAKLNIGGVGTGYTSKLPSNNGKDAPNGEGGKHHYREYNGTKFYESGYSGGGGYAGGGGGMETVTDTAYFDGAGGGASSFLHASYTAIENSQGTNDGSESFLITQSNITLKDKLTNGYTNPIIYRGNLLIDTTNHRANIKTVNTNAQNFVDLRILIHSPSLAFWDIASWIETTLNLTPVYARISVGETQDIDESKYIEVTPASISKTTKETRFELANKAAIKHAVIRIRINKSDAVQDYIYKIFGVIN